MDFTYNNKVIEFNGDYYHCNPKLYNSNFYNGVRKQYANEIWEYDNNKKNSIVNSGYSLLIIWEDEYNKDSDIVIKKCIEFIQDD